LKGLDFDKLEIEGVLSFVHLQRQQLTENSSVFNELHQYLSSFNMNTSLDQTPKYCHNALFHLIQMNEASNDVQIDNKAIYSYSYHDDIDAIEWTDLMTWQEKGMIYPLRSHYNPLHHTQSTITSNEPYLLLIDDLETIETIFSNFESSRIFLSKSLQIMYGFHNNFDKNSEMSQGKIVTIIAFGQVFPVESMQLLSPQYHLPSLVEYARYR
jgi:hypothetical protein